MSGVFMPKALVLPAIMTGKTPAALIVRECLQAIMGSEITRSVIHFHLILSFLFDLCSFTVIE